MNCRNKRPRDTRLIYKISIFLCFTFFLTGCASIKKSRTFASTNKSSHHLRSPSSLGLSEYGYIWPVDYIKSGGHISSYFGKRRRNFHDGIDIGSPRGTAVRAVKDGSVLYASRRIKGYGNMIVLKHDDGTATVYAHNQKNLVAKGDVIKQGDVIARLGNTGKSTGPHLHFEIRNGEHPVDPILYLPPVSLKSSNQARNFQN